MDFVVTPLYKLENVTRSFTIKELVNEEEIDSSCTFTEPMTKHQKRARKKNAKQDDLSKYWHQRYSYFKKMDHGMKI